MHGFLYLLDSYFLGCFIPRAIHPAGQPASLASHSAKQVTRLPYAQPRHRVSCRVRLCKFPTKTSNRPASPANQSREAASRSNQKEDRWESDPDDWRQAVPGLAVSVYHMYVSRLQENRTGSGKIVTWGSRSGSRLGNSSTDKAPKLPVP